MEPFLLNALLGGAGMALMAGPLGCFIAWQRLAYFGDTVGHAALLGVALGLLFSVNMTVAIMAVSLVLAVLLARMQARGQLASDTLLGVLAHGALALGLVIVALMQYPLDIQAFLFGDILTVTAQDLGLIYGTAACVGLWLAANWHRLMLMVVNAEIAQVEGVDVARLRLALMVVIALAVAVSIKLVGMLLITSMLIIPAAAARSFARTPHGMAALAALLGVLAVAGGLAASLQWDTPSGPSIILAALGLFGASRVMRSSR